ncbi:MAG TPA: glycine--tRNA ligase subunit beta [Oscillospiraceae bacterium]|nr:glycine--tRNA ligase subunit beta [Oscillospiraceae bacterium]
MRKESFLLEIGTEEIPARFISPALAQLAEAAAAEMKQQRLAYEDIKVYGTPRRLALLVSKVAEKQQTLEEKKKGPAVKAAYDAHGKPTPAAQGFARSQGVAVEELFTADVSGVPYVFAVRREAAHDVQTILPQLCARLIRSLNFPKPMFWHSKDVRFARPIRWLTALWGSTPIPFSFAGLTAANVTYGHRFLAAEAVKLKEAADYPQVMQQNFVMAEPQERKTKIAALVKEAARALGGHSVLHEDLLEEVVNLVEYPRVITGEFASAYLEVPQEVLITAMRTHQRYFPVFGEDNKLLPNFITISNGTSEEYAKNVRAGNERVLRARLADARFFFEEDRKQPLAAYVDKLDKIVFMEALGTMRQKTARTIKLVQRLAEELKVDASVREAAERATFLAKADLMTQMVSEFPELQGTMGMHYARLSGESAAVATAIDEHYAPRFAGDTPPATLPGALVALADKMDTLAACFALGLIPTGSQDPYALRRSAAGVVVTLADHSLPITIERLSELALSELQANLTQPAAEVTAQLADFMLQRVRYTFVEQGLRYDVIEAVLAGAVHNLPALWQRAQVLQDKLNSPELTQILIPFTRVANLSRSEHSEVVQPKLLTAVAEKELYQALLTAEKSVQAAAGRSDFTAVFTALAPLYQPIENFFADVMVMAEDVTVRQNRLALLAQIKKLFLTLGDISTIVPEKK